MKKIASIVSGFTVCVAMIFVLAGCGEKQQPVNLDILSQELLDKATFQEELVLLDREVATHLYPMAEDTKGRVLAGSGATAEEIALFETKEESEAKNMLEAAQKRVESQKAAFENYAPKEMEKLNKAIVFQKGNYVVVCITDDVDNAQKILNKYFA
ncbi:MAG: DUF4358 domain-containing protein [Clostridiales bacterium]|jgi:hypothetical protein|nr:DUF4358 domain-containing protein [Clostridiales bacterium]